jgi:hypothetical protein
VPDVGLPLHDFRHGPGFPSLWIIGYNKALDSLAPTGSIGWHLQMTTDTAMLDPSLEIGRYALGARDVVTSRGENRRYEESLFHIGPAVTVGPSNGTIRPYANFDIACRACSSVAREDDGLTNG